MAEEILLPLHRRRQRADRGRSRQHRAPHDPAVPVGGVVGRLHTLLVHLVRLLLGARQPVRLVDAPVAPPVAAERTAIRPVADELDGGTEPAVGGEPSEKALPLIPALEGLDRGWYAGPVGWTDLAEDGEFCVALRCALLRGDVAHLYAGEGIVGDSEPAQELEANEAKLQALLPLLT